MEIAEEAPKKKTWLYIIIIVLVIAIAIVYFTFLSPGLLGGLFKGKITDLSLVPDALKKDVTGGIAELKFTPEDILENPKFKSLRVYAEPVELTTTPGRPNPFIPF